MQLHHFKFLKFARVFTLALCFSIAGPVISAEKITVKVGGYNFPPFVEKDGKAGMVSDLIKRMNKSQEHFKFIFSGTSANRRYRDLKDKKFDLIFFEDEAWSWDKSGVAYNKTGVVLNGGEVYVTLNKDSRDQKYFDSFDGKKIRGIFGYHYNFANMKTDPEVLRKKGVSLGQSNEENLKDLLDGRVDIIVMNSFMVEETLRRNMALKEKLLVSTKKDQTYHLRILLNKKSPISPMEIENLTTTNLK